MEYPVNPNPSCKNDFAGNFDPFEFELSDYLVLGDGFENDPVMERMATSSSSGHIQEISANGIAHAAEGDTTNYNIEYVNGLKKKKIERGTRVAFRTKSELEVMDDGYKWRKYGKKSVKNNPNPRNYYKCSSGTCQVKKRVERDREDSSFVITTYEGVHNHDTPSTFTTTTNIDSLLYYSVDRYQHERFSPDLSALQASNCSNSSSSS